jgi:hypothetical protein
VKRGAVPSASLRGPKAETSFRSPKLRSAAVWYFGGAGDFREGEARCSSVGKPPVTESGNEFPQSKAFALLRCGIPAGPATLGRDLRRAGSGAVASFGGKADESPFSGEALHPAPFPFCTPSPAFFALSPRLCAPSPKSPCAAAAPAPFQANLPDAFPWLIRTINARLSPSPRGGGRRGSPGSRCT